MRSHYRLLNDQELVRQMHFPKNQTESLQARRSAIFREFFLFELQIESLRVQNHNSDTGLQLNYDLGALKEFIQTLPFELTAAQKRVVNEICADLKDAHHMNRLLQGDVASGKTVVAAIAMFVSDLNGAENEMPDDVRSPPTIYPYTQTSSAPIFSFACETFIAQSMSDPLPGFPLPGPPMMNSSPLQLREVSTWICIPPLSPVADAGGTVRLTDRISLAFRTLVNNILSVPPSRIIRLTLPGLKYAILFSE